MRPRSLLFVAGLLLALGLGWWFRPPPTAPGPGVAPEAANVPAPRPAAPAPGGLDRLAQSEIAPPSGSTPGSGAPNVAPPPPFNPADFPIAAPLNAAGSTVARDLQVLQHLFDAWRSNFPREGNPVGENADITAALAGQNRLGLTLVPRSHPAVNAAGELCDRWGTPFRFHQLSGEHMEIRSAGPDRKFATDDDAVLTPQ